MYFSAREFHDYATRTGRWDQIHTALNGRPRDGYNSNLVRTPLPLKDVRKGLGLIKKAIAERNPYYLGLGTSKWNRPWDVVPSLASFRPAPGDMGVGVEIELGFRSAAAARRVTTHLYNWKHITLDFEGGSNPIEATFPPTPYSKLGKRSQVIRYLQFLTDNEDLVTRHSPGRTAGTHVNVSSGDYARIPTDRLYGATRLIQTFDYDENIRYFGRRPYGYGYIQTQTSGGGHYTDQGQWIEWKLFHSTTDVARFTQYVNVGVALTRFICSEQPMNRASLIVALELGYSGQIKAAIKADIAARNAVVTPAEFNLSLAA